MTTQRVTRRRGAPTQATLPDMSKVKVTPFYMSIDDIVPYEDNARYNEKAIDAVANSIKNFGFIVPVVVDDEGNLAAGHTRLLAAKKLQLDEVLAIRASHLTTEQIDAFRLVDNKVSELADWNTDLLGVEMARLADQFDFTDFGWQQEEIDCLSQMVSSDCLSVAEIVPESQRQAPGVTTRRAPTQSRFVLGELVFFTEANAYRNWVDGIRRLHNFDEAAIIDDLKNRLGILE